MLDPSSSEEESDELQEEERRRDGPGAPAGGSLPPPREVRGREGGAGRAATPGPSPSPSVLSEGREEQERLQREEREKRLQLQLYVFIARCIAHPFNAKQPTDMARRQQKVSPPRRAAPLPARTHGRDPRHLPFGPPEARGWRRGAEGTASPWGPSREFPELPQNRALGARREAARLSEVSRGRQRGPEAAGAPRGAPEPRCGVERWRRLPSSSGQPHQNHFVPSSIRDVRVSREAAGGWAACGGARLFLLRDF